MDTGESGFTSTKKIHSSSTKKVSPSLGCFTLSRQQVWASEVRVACCGSASTRRSSVSTAVDENEGLYGTTDTSLSPSSSVVALGISSPGPPSSKRLSLGLPPRSSISDSFSRYGYSHVSVLSHGCTGSTHLVRSLVDGYDWVAKVIELSCFEKDGLDSACREAKLLRQLDHPHIVRFKESYLNAVDEIYVIVMEYCEGGDLFCKIRKTEEQEKKSTEKDILRWTLQLASALEYIHSEGILHCDVKINNIFLTRNVSNVSDVKIGDFGVACELRKGANALSPIRCPHGTPHYMSPEMLRRRSLTSKSDCWALGCVLFELCCNSHVDLRERSFVEPSTKSQDEENATKWDPFQYGDFPSHYSRFLKGIIYRLLHRVSEERVSIQDLLQELKSHTSSSSSSVSDSKDTNPHPQTPTPSTVVHAPYVVNAVSPSPSNDATPSVSAAIKRIC